jgi:hypothetical protein
LTAPTSSNAETRAEKEKRLATLKELRAQKQREADQAAYERTYNDPAAWEPVEPDAWGMM